jgi:DNA-binding protein YbaB
VEAARIGRNLDDAEEWLRSWTAQASARAEAAQQMSDRVVGLKSTASVANGAITVTVAGSGIVTGLELDDRVQRFSGRDLSTQIMRAIQKAQAGLNQKVAAVVAETVGAETETGQAVLGSFVRSCLRCSIRCCAAPSKRSTTRRRRWRAPRGGSRSPLT